MQRYQLLNQVVHIYRECHLLLVRNTATTQSGSESLPAASMHEYHSVSNCRLVMQISTVSYHTSTMNHCVFILLLMSFSIKLLVLYNCTKGQKTVKTETV